MDFGLDGLSIALILLGVLLVLVLFAGAKTVPQGYNYTVERFGRYIRTLKSLSPNRRGLKVAALPSAMTA